jgi:tRNA threonylcarbamoyladenosine biosynthesis protein TsaE
MKRFIPDEQGMLDLGAELASQYSTGGIILLYGDLGAGKTTLVRGLLRAFGHKGNVKSPTYTLVEPYHLQDLDIFHFDLYRMADPEELEYMGGRDYFRSDTLSLIEWPEKAQGYLPPADLNVLLSYHKQGRYAELLSSE